MSALWVIQLIHQIDVYRLLLLCYYVKFLLISLLDLRYLRAYALQSS